MMLSREPATPETLRLRKALPERKEKPLREFHNTLYAVV